MKRTSVHLDEEQVAALDRRAAQEGVSRAELIRRLLDRALTNTDENPASDLHAIEKSFRALRDIEEPARHPGDREVHLAKLRRRSS